MDKKDLLGLELQSIMEEDTRDISLSQEKVDFILANSKKERKKSLGLKIKHFLNKEIEIPLLPALAGLTAFLIFTCLPKGILTHENKEIIKIGPSQVIISSREVTRK